MSRACVGGLGESGILRILDRRFAALPAAGDWPEGTVGPGDDAAVVAAPDGRFVITVDAMAQDRDFRLRWPAAAPGSPGGSGRRAAAAADFGSGYSIGWKAAAQNLSDVNAMGATASGLLLALTLPASTPVDWVDGLAAGIAGAVRHLGAEHCRVVGGDLGGDDRITVAITATGDLGGRPAVRRRLASIPGDSVPGAPESGGAGSTGSVAGIGLDLVHCGRAGWAAAGLAVLDTPRDELLRRLEAAERAAGEGPVGGHGLRRTAALAATAQLRPRPPLGRGRHAAEAGVLAMMDVSDGLLRDAGRLAAANGLAAVLDEDWVHRSARDLVPLARVLGRDAADWVRSGGEDYGLLAVVPAGAEAPTGFSRVGRLVVPPEVPATEGCAAAVGDGAGGPVGWDHFEARPGRTLPDGEGRRPLG